MEDTNMIGSLKSNVNINFRRLAVRLMAGLSAVTLLSAVAVSEARHVAPDPDAFHEGAAFANAFAAVDRVDTPRVTGIGAFDAPFAVGNAHDTNAFAPAAVAHFDSASPAFAHSDFAHSDFANSDFANSALAHFDGARFDFAHFAAAESAAAHFNAAHFDVAHFDGAGIAFGREAFARRDFARRGFTHQAEDVDGLHVVHIDSSGGAPPFVYTTVAVHSFGDRPSFFQVTDGGRVIQHAAFRSTGDAAAALPSPRAIDAGYVRRATGIDLFGAPKDWHEFAARYGYYVSDRPVPGGVVCFEGGAYGASEAYGFVGVVVYYQDRGEHWEIVTRYAYPTDGRGYDGDYVKEQSFRVLKNDPRAHYIYRGGDNARPGGYYTRPEYAGHNVVGEDYVFQGEAKDVVAVRPEDEHARAYVRPGQVIRVLAKAEVGETLWVFVETPYRAGTVYAVTHYGGGARLVKYDGSSPDAQRMYYAKNYGDTVLDLGYADYSGIAGDSGEVNITVKKGGDPAHLVTLQTVRLQLERK
jgi:hypothetical protein